ncbi:unnamed protein product, partial [Polarella glacialis]
ETTSLNDAGAIRDYNNNDNNHNYNYNNLSNYKTRRCVHQYRGICSFGLQCSFARNEAELFRNSNFKPVLCKNLRGGTCHVGLRCRFAHSEPEMFPNQQQQPPFRSSQSSRKLWVAVTPIAEQQQQQQLQT